MGWIKLYDKITEWEYFNDEGMLRLWIWLLLHAAFKDTEYKGVRVNRGQLIVSQSQLAKELKMTKRMIQTRLSKLVKINQITMVIGTRTNQMYQPNVPTKCTNLMYQQGTLITISNFDTYQTSKPRVCTNQMYQHDVISTCTDQMSHKNKNIYIQPLNNCSPNNTCTSLIKGDKKVDDNAHTRDTREPQPEINPMYRGFLDWCRENATLVLEMRDPMTEKQFLKLRSDFNSRDIADIVTEMGNRPDLTRKYVSAYLTARTWLRRRVREAEEKGLAKKSRVEQAVEDMRRQKEIDDMRFGNQSAGIDTKQLKLLTK